MDGLQFQVATTPVRSDPARADVACFVGFVAPRRSAGAQRARLERALRDLGWHGPALPATARVLPDDILSAGESSRSFERWLARLGWRPDLNAVSGADLFRKAAEAVLGTALVEWLVEAGWLSPVSTRSAADLLELADVPVPIHSWDAFHALFAWDQRPFIDGRSGISTMGAAVRRFFLQGGRKSNVVRVGDPWGFFTPLDQRAAFRSRLLAALPPPAPVDRSTWRGIGHLFGLPDVSFLTVPDVPELFAVDTPAVAPETESEGDERFVECATRTVPPSSRSLRPFPVPRCDAAGFRAWAALVSNVGGLLARYCREVQLVAALPLAVDETSMRDHPEVRDLPPAERHRALARRSFASRTAQWDAAASIQTAFVQLVYPWLRTAESHTLPGALEPPDALLTGLLAGNALTQGTWRSVARQPVFGLTAVEPVLSAEQLDRPLAYEGAGRLRVPRTVRDRISIVAPTPTGFQMLSDVTTDDDEAYRPANINRLVASIVRAARLLGEGAAFTNSGEAVWRRLQSSLDALLLGLWGDGALDGATSSEAYTVRCDRSTMTQADIDAGRVIARVQFNAASPIQRIVVVFAVEEGGQVTIVPGTDDALEASA